MSRMKPLTIHREAGATGSHGAAAQPLAARPAAVEPPTAEPAATEPDSAALAALALRVKAWGRELGFGAVGISDIDLSQAEAGLIAWLEAGYHGAMDYMAKHGVTRARPAQLVAGTVRVITVRLPYLPRAAFSGDGDGDEGRAELPAPPEVPPRPQAATTWREREHARLRDPQAAVVSVYARGRDYHKVMRARLKRLAERIEAEIGPFGYRVFSDSAPVLEVELAQKGGLGWRGKHTLLLHQDAGSLFFLGEIFVDVALPSDAELTPHAVPSTDGQHCGTCTRCIDSCPTGAILAPYRLDARRCISYLTIELHGSIPEPLRALIGNRIYGCDDCQLVCPWNKYAQAGDPDFDVRNGLDSSSLIELFAWTEAEFNTRLEGSAIRRIGHERWLRNIAVALGNALAAGGDAPESGGGRFGTPADTLAARADDCAATGAITDSAARITIRAATRAALSSRAEHPSAVVREHVAWALEQG
jgi:epoxyqueuosine reductase